MTGEDAPRRVSLLVRQALRHEPVGEVPSPSGSFFVRVMPLLVSGPPPGREFNASTEGWACLSSPASVRPASPAHLGRFSRHESWRNQSV